MAKPYDPKDRFFQKAKDQGFRARSAFKIEEILRRQKLLGKGGSVLDLGAAPGGFLQILAEVVGLDIVPIQRLAQPWVKTAVLDLLAPEALERIQELHPGRFDLVTSDMAPKTIGVKITDEARSLELSRMALAVAGDTLKLGGAFVVKVFMGGDFPVFQKEMRARFGKVDVVRPEATRERSFEVYVVGSDFKPPPSGGGTVALR
jgi:23S rRNA (uridine2552-2'-O)-methyltransferase